MRRTRAWGAWTGRVAAALVSVGVVGCLQLETLIEVNLDESATVTERLQFSEGLLDQASQAGPEYDLVSLLTKEAALERMKQMGQGVSLTSHQTREVAGGARESVAVFRVDNISQFTYVSPYLSVTNYPKHHTIKCTMFPVYRTTWWGRPEGYMGVSFQATSAEPERGRQAPPPLPAPAQLQALRDVEPLFRDLMKDFRLRITFKAYSPLRFRQYYRYRGRLEMTHTYDLIDFSDKNLDKYGSDFLGNEEVLLELLRMNTAGPNVTDHVAGHADNPTLPVYHFQSTPEIYFRPSRQMFDKYFQGKMLTSDFDRDQTTSRPARFEEIGFKGPAATQKTTP